MEGLKEMKSSVSGKALCPLVESYKYTLLHLKARSSCWRHTVAQLLPCQGLDLHHHSPSEPGCDRPGPISSLPLLITNYILQNMWPFGKLLCKLVHFLIYDNLYSSILMLTFISVHCFLGISCPIHFLPYHSWHLAVAGTATSCVLVLLQLLPTLIYACYYQ